MLPVANTNNQLDIGIGIGYLHIGNNSAPPPLIATHAPAALFPRVKSLHFWRVSSDMWRILYHILASAERRKRHFKYFRPSTSVKMRICWMAISFSFLRR